MRRERGIVERRVSQLLVTLACCSSLTTCDAWLMKSRPPSGLTFKAVRLAEPGGHMEVVQEEHCSEESVRLTCRSLKAFMFLLEADYGANRTETCNDRSIGIRKNLHYFTGNTVKVGDRDRSRGNYVDDELVGEEGEDEGAGGVDVRSSVNKRCAGLQHCRFNLVADHPEAIFWGPGTLRLKFACIPEAAVHKHCNVHVKVSDREGGYIKSPGYPLYYTRGGSCGWTFKSLPGQRIVLTFYDLDIRKAEADGSCIDVVRVRDSGNTLFENCATLAGLKIVSNSNVLTIDLVTSQVLDPQRLYPARGFFLHYQVLGCPDIFAPNGSFVSNGTMTSRVFLCRLGSVFPDTKQRKRIVECKDGKWSETATSLPACVVRLLKKVEKKRVMILSSRC
ncbi:uncharacterized protein [Prorops nasuta]|uniref:uncharacterized protein isoform X2 n=1 Tax=Prorops nasuta TaxID=863751 RepID=UPI0034CF9BC8